MGDADSDVSSPPSPFLQPDLLDAPLSTALDTTTLKYAVRGAIFRRRTRSASTSEPDINADADSPHELLLLKRSEGERSLQNHWEIPGGEVEVHANADGDPEAEAEADGDASIRAALAREVREETGLHVSRVLGEVTRNRYTSPRRGREWVEFDFAVRVEEQEQRTKDEGGAAGGGGGGGGGGGEMLVIELSLDEHSEWRWVREEQVDELLMVAGMRRVVRKAFAFARRYIKYSR